MAEPEGTTAEAPEQAAPESNPIEERLSSFMDEMRTEVGGLREQLTAPAEEDYGYDAYAPPGQQGPSPYGPADPYAAQPGYGDEPQAPPGHTVLYDAQDNPVFVPDHLAQQALQQPGVTQQPLPGQPYGDPNAGLQQLVPQLREALGIDDLQQWRQQQTTLARYGEYAQRFPELDQPEVTQAAATAWEKECDRIGRPDLKMDVDLMVKNWLAERAANGAASGTPAGSAPGMQLEAGGGATPEAAQVDPGQAIEDAMRGRNPFA